MIRSSIPVTVGGVQEHYDELDRYYREIWVQRKYN